MLDIDDELRWLPALIETPVILTNEIWCIFSAGKKCVVYDAVFHPDTYNKGQEVCTINNNKEVVSFVLVCFFPNHFILHVLFRYPHFPPPDINMLSTRSANWKCSAYIIFVNKLIFALIRTKGLNS